MHLHEIIGKGKIFEPPFKVAYDEELEDMAIMDKHDEVVLPISQIRLKYDDRRIVFAEHVCHLLNKEHVKRHRMCLKDRTKRCTLCHECDIDVSNPGGLFCSNY